MFGSPSQFFVVRLGILLLELVKTMRNVGTFGIAVKIWTGVLEDTNCRVLLLQNSTVDYSTVEYSILQYSKVQ